MTEAEFIKSLEASNPKLFAAEKIQLTPDSFKQQLRRAYRAGADELSQQHKGADLFNTIFK